MRKLVVKTYNLEEFPKQIEIITEIVVKYILGSGLNELVSDYGISYGCIRKILIDNNIKLRDKGKQRKDV